MISLFSNSIQELTMDRELDFEEIQIQQKAKQLLEGLQAIANLSNDLNLSNLVLEIDFLSLILSEDSKFIARTRRIKELYETAVDNVAMLHTTLTAIEIQGLDL